MKDGTVWRAILACMLYLIVSMFMIVLNKAVTRTNAGDATALLLLWQMSCTVVFLGALEHCQCLRLEPVRWSSLNRILPVTVFYVLNVGVSLLAIRHLNLTAYSAVKRLTPLCIVPLDRVLRGVVMTWSQLFACFVMVIGTLFMARFDVTSSWRAYLLGLASCICQATYMVLVKVRGSANEKSLSTTSMLKLNSLVAVPMLLPLVILFGQVDSTVRNAHWGRVEILVPLVIWPAVGMLLNYALFLCATVANPMTVTIVGHLKGAILSIGGFFLFEGAPMTFFFGMGLTLNVLGSFWYMRCQLRKYVQSEASAGDRLRKVDAAGT